MVLKIFSALMFFLLSGCGKAPNLDEILGNAVLHSVEIQEIAERGFSLCREDLKLADISLRKTDDWSPTRFNEHDRLSELLGIKIRYVSFYYSSGEFNGILMRISPNLILYKGKSVYSKITIAGNSFVQGKSKGEFVFFLKE
jgi:hypothetical protein